MTEEEFQQCWCILGSGWKVLASELILVRQYSILKKVSNLIKLVLFYQNISIKNVLINNLTLFPP